MSGRRLHILLAVLPMLLAGCSWFGNSEPRTRQVGAEAFYRGVPGSEDRQELNNDRSGAIRDPYAPPVPRPTAPTAAERTAAATRVPATAPANLDTVGHAPATTVSVASQSIPATGDGQYLTIGAVVVEVGRSPIFADRVVRRLAPALSREAKSRTEEEFRGFAMTQINQLVGQMVRDEILYSAAEKNLTSEERDRAWALTGAWRDNLQRQEGGSIELARKRAKDDGIDFDEMVNDRYRGTMVYMYKNKKILPRVPVTVEEMRRYYDEHLQKEFSDVDQAQFRVIKIVVARTPGETPSDRRNNALNKIKDLRQNLADRSDADFAKVASESNDDPLLKRTSGRVGDESGWMQRGAYAITKVENAVWQLQPGQLTDVIESDNGDAYFIARLSDRKLGHAKPFEDPDVQAQILESIRAPQTNALTEKMVEELEKDAIVSPPDPRNWRIQPVFEMVMQMYPVWAAGGK